ncbi:uncharacterized protein [Prorops nasuta]|uniref:uncharacterized protein isoform X2 n=1 Tax=Prorops nasuta TaxID=863751 RepID=UPI0034CEC6CB
MPGAYRCYICKSKRSNNIVLHKFPANKTLCLAWMKICGLTDGLYEPSTSLEPSAERVSTVANVALVTSVSSVSPETSVFSSMVNDCIPGLNEPPTLLEPSAESISTVVNEAAVTSIQSVSSVFPTMGNECICGYSTNGNNDDEVVTTTPKRRLYKEPRYINEIKEIETGNCLYDDINILHVSAEKKILNVL